MPNYWQDSVYLLKIALEIGFQKLLIPETNLLIASSYSKTWENKMLTTWNAPGIYILLQRLRLTYNSHFFTFSKNKGIFPDVFVLQTTGTTKLHETTWKQIFQFGTLDTNYYQRKRVLLIFLGNFLGVKVHIQYTLCNMKLRQVRVSIAFYHFTYLSIVDENTNVLLIYE